MDKFIKVGVSQSKKKRWIHILNAFSIYFFSAIDGKKGTINEGKPQEGTTAQVTITVDDNDFVDLALGKANAPAVFMNIYNRIYIMLFFYFIAFC